MEQRTDAWFQERAGKVTASRIYEISKKGRDGKYLKAREEYLDQLLCERLTQLPTETKQSREMQRGTELEPKARAVYIIETGNDVEEVGFIPHPTIGGSGASPDGLVYPDGLIEIKCPNTKTHIEFLKTGIPKPEYLAQMQWQMACTGRQWCDFVSYDDRLPEHLAFKSVRIGRDEESIKALEAEAVKFLQALAWAQEELEKLC